MKVRDMDVYFSVPVDRAVLKACRVAAGYDTAKQFQEALDCKGVAVSYRYIENQVKDAQGNPKRIRGDVAELIAEALGVPPDTAFPAYSASKAAAVRDVDERYYKPFTTIEGRNAAIIAAMENVRKAALKHCHLLKNQNGGHYLEQEDIIGLAYISLVDMANRAMKKGIKKGVCFEAAACVAVKNDFLRMNKDNRTLRRKAEVHSLDAFAYDDDDSDRNFYNIRPGSYCIEDQIVLRDEVRQAVQNLTDDQKEDAHIKEMMEELGINPKRRAACA